MGEVKWIKITVSMFEDDKIEFIESLPEADAILVVWIKLLTMAGKCNAGGFIFLTEKIPYTVDMLAHKFRRPIATVKLALEVLKRLDMIEFDDHRLRIVNWEKHQNIEGLERIREQNRLRKQRQRERERLEAQQLALAQLTLEEEAVTGEVTGRSRDGHALDIDLDKEKEEERDLKDHLSKTDVLDYQSLVDMYHDLCPSLPRIKKLNTNRKTLLRARFKDHGLDGLRTLFEKAEASDFLSGRSGRWKGASFDWLLKDSNCLKVLEGNYDNTPVQYGGRSKNTGETAAQQMLRQELAKEQGDIIDVEWE